MTTPFKHLLAAYQRRAYLAALGWVGNEQEAHELAQDALLKAWKARQSYDSARPFYPWLHVIVKNVCRDALARSARAPLPGLKAERVVDAAPQPEAGLRLRQREQRLYAAMRLLDDHHREILVLRHFEDLSYAEIAEVLNLAVGTVMSRLFRARKALLHQLETEDI